MDIESITQPTPTLETLWRKARDGLIPWSAVQDYQSNLMPRCMNHAKRPMATYQDDNALCVDCYIAWMDAQRDVQATPDEALKGWHR